MDDYEVELRLRARLISEGILRPNPFPNEGRPTMSPQVVKSLKETLVKHGFITPATPEAPGKRVVFKLH